MAEREEPRVSEQQIESEPQHGEERDLGRGGVGEPDSVTDERQDRERRGEDGERMFGDHSNFSNFSPISPRGRKSRISTMRTYIEASAAGG